MLTDAIEVCCRAGEAGGLLERIEGDCVAWMGGVFIAASVSVKFTRFELPGVHAVFVMAGSLSRLSLSCAPPSSTSTARPSMRRVSGDRDRSDWLARNDWLL